MLRQAQQPLTTVAASGLDLSIFPWEDAATYVADVEAYLAETEAKPWLGAEDLDLMTPDMDAIVNDPTYDRWLNIAALSAGGQTGARLDEALVPELLQRQGGLRRQRDPLLALARFSWGANLHRFIPPMS